MIDTDEVELADQRRREELKSAVIERENGNPQGEKIVLDY